MDIIIAFILGCITGALLAIFCLSLAYAAKCRDKSDKDESTTHDLKRLELEK